MSRLRKRLLFVGLALTVLVAAGLFMIHRSGAWFLLFPSHDHDTTPPAIPADFGQSGGLRVLVFSKTNSFRHEDGIAGMRQILDAMAARRGLSLFHSENGAVFDADHLARFDVVVFSNASGDMLSDEQDRAFQTWLENGGGWVGIHSAGDGSHDAWRWYHDELIGASFVGHIMGPQTQRARVVVEDRTHPVTRDLPADFFHEEEWYSWDRSPRDQGFHVLLSLDESSYDPTIRIMGSATDIRMGDHPIAWWRCIGSGRTLYTAMGHWGRAYENPDAAQLLENAIAWAGDPDACSPAAIREPVDPPRSNNPELDRGTPAAPAAAGGAASASASASASAQEP